MRLNLGSLHLRGDLWPFGSSQVSIFIRSRTLEPCFVLLHLWWLVVQYIPKFLWSKFTRHGDGSLLTYVQRAFETLLLSSWTSVVFFLRVQVQLRNVEEDVVENHVGSSYYWAVFLQVLHPWVTLCWLFLYEAELVGLFFVGGLNSFIWMRVKAVSLEGWNNIGWQCF